MMASGGNDDHPLDTDPRRLRRQLSRDDIANQGRYLIHNFIHDRLMRDGVANVPEVENMIAPGTPTGPPVEKLTEVANALKCIGDELDNDTSLQRMLSRCTPNSPRQTFFNVAREIFADGLFNWGRVGALFYFAYKMALKALNELPLIRVIVDWVVEFIQDYVAPWIIGRGGWEAIIEYFGSTATQFAAVAACCAVVIGLVYMVKR